MIRVQADDFDAGAELAAFSAANAASAGAGGICLFMGLVRGDAGANAMTLEHYPGMTERCLAAIEVQARQRWPLRDVLVIHRFGRLAVGERIVLVATAADHRDAAFLSCQFLMDWLKTKAPFWKVEHRPNGDNWVAAKAADDHAAERWDDPAAR